MKAHTIPLSISLMAAAISCSGALCAQDLDAVETMEDVQTQGQLIHILQVINEREMSEADLALNHTEHEDVKAYAQQLINDHESSARRIEELVRSGVQPESGELAEQLAAQAGERLQEMSARNDAHLDCVFLSNQVAQHEFGIRLLSLKLQPEVEDENVQEFLDLSLADFERHRAGAQALLDESICSDPPTTR